MHSNLEMYKYVCQHEILNKNLTNSDKYPMMIRTNGLLNFWGYLIKKENSNEEIRFFKYVFENKMYSEAQEIIGYLMKLPTEEYRTLTMETYKLACVLKMNCSGEKEVD